MSGLVLVYGFAVGLTVGLLWLGLRTAFNARRCAALGHRWDLTPTGTRCLRCKHVMEVGDQM